MVSKNQNKYTVEGLKQQFPKLAEAKAFFGLKARGWQALADKLNQPSLEDLKSQLEQLREQVAVLQAENEQLRASLAKGNGFDEAGFWLLDGNFERSKFEDFGIGENATEMESKAKAEYRRLAQKYHPDNGGTDEQMANVNRLYEQMISLVKINGGMGL
ncbi:MAG: hypothetical protein VKK04_25715 [Synechococcales bacterium]|nr:hypothetical protein [Synechococcales bacterium]